MFKIEKFQTLAEFNEAKPNLGYNYVAYVVENDHVYYGNSSSIPTPSGGGGGMTEITYYDLYTKAAHDDLTPGMYYRITDYNTIVDETYDIKSTENGFDIIVLALTENKLSEDAFATKTESCSLYFEQSNLSAWRLKYDIRGTKYKWAGDGNKGVIYYMKDEFGNEAPYDFKNIMYKSYIISSMENDEHSIYLGQSKGLFYNHIITPLGAEFATPSCGCSCGCDCGSSYNYEYKYTFNIKINGHNYDATVASERCLNNKIIQNRINLNNDLQLNYYELPYVLFDLNTASCGVDTYLRNNVVENSKNIVFGYGENNIIKNCEDICTIDENNNNIFINVKHFISYGSSHQHVIINSEYVYVSVNTYRNIIKNCTNIYLPDSSHNININGCHYVFFKHLSGCEHVTDDINAIKSLPNLLGISNITIEPYNTKIVLTVEDAHAHLINVHIFPGCNVINHFKTIPIDYTTSSHYIYAEDAEILNV